MMQEMIKKQLAEEKERERIDLELAKKMQNEMNN